MIADSHGSVYHTNYGLLDFQETTHFTTSLIIRGILFSEVICSDLNYL